jgi:hypothetical protein
VITTNKTAEEEYTAIERAFKETDQVSYYSVFGPNSNTYLNQLLINAGFPTPRPSGATGWDYSGEYKYGGTYFTVNGKPTAAYKALLERQREEVERHREDMKELWHRRTRYPGAGFVR